MTLLQDTDKRREVIITVDVQKVAPSSPEFPAVLAIWMHANYSACI